MLGRDLCDRRGVNLCVLANVERLQVQAVGAHLEQQRVDQQLGEAVAAVLDERVAQSGEVGEQIDSARVRSERWIWR